MERLVFAVVLVAIAAVVAAVIQRRQPDAPTSPPMQYRVPSQVDRADFSRPETPWLVAVFTSATCDSCRGAWDKAALLDSKAVTVEQIEIGAEPQLHKRYQVDGVPLIVIADAEGVVCASFVGEPTATDLWATMAEVRDPGSVPEGCDHGQG